MRISSIRKQRAILVLNSKRSRPSSCRVSVPINAQVYLVRLCIHHRSTKAKTSLYKSTKHTPAVTFNSSTAFQHPNATSELESDDCTESDPDTDDDSSTKTADKNPAVPDNDDSSTVTADRNLITSESLPASEIPTICSISHRNSYSIYDPKIHNSISLTFESTKIKSIVFVDYSLFHRSTIALIRNDNNIIYRYIVIFGCIELHGDDGRRLRWFNVLKRDSDSNSVMSLDRMAVQEFQNKIPISRNVIGLTLTHRNTVPTAYEWPFDQSFISLTAKKPDKKPKPGSKPKPDTTPSNSPAKPCLAPGCPNCSQCITADQMASHLEICSGLSGHQLQLYRATMTPEQLRVWQLFSDPNLCLELPNNHPYDFR